MKIRNLLFSFVLLASGFVSQAQDLDFTTTGSCASYITYNNWYSRQADSIYTIKKASEAITIDGVAEGAWDKANTGILRKIVHEQPVGGTLDLSKYPQSETDLYATYKALWTENGVYMLIEVKDDMVRYQNPEFQWENDGIEFFFAKAPGDGKIQVIIPAMVGTPNPAKPAAKDFESGSATGSDPDYKVFGYDANNWDESTFKWAVKKTATGYTMEVYMDKDIVTNGNSDTNFGDGKMFAGDINVDEADETQNSNDPALYVRDGTLAMMGNYIHEYDNSNYYGYFKMVDDTKVEEELYFTVSGSAASYITYNNWDSRQADSTYTIERTNKTINIDGVADDAYSVAKTGVLRKIMNELKVGNDLDLSAYPQSETDLYATFKALWTDNGVYMFIEVKDDMVRYQNVDYQWENDGIEFFFAKAPGESKVQIIIPAMVGTTNPDYPAAKDLETGSATGSNPSYKVFGYDANNWDESTFNWAIKKTAVGYNMEVYMDKDIVTNGNSDTNFGAGKTFGGDINIDEADEKQNSNTPPLYVRESILGMMGNYIHEYDNSTFYGWFKMVDNTTGIDKISKAPGLDAYYSASAKQILVKNSSVATVTLYNITGQAVSAEFKDGVIAVSHLKNGVYILSAKDKSGNRLGSQKLVIF